MKFETLSTTSNTNQAAHTAIDKFGERAVNMEFFVKEGIPFTVTTFLILNGPNGKIFEWYQYNDTKNEWQATHILHQENWLEPDAFQKEE